MFNDNFKHEMDSLEDESYRNHNRRHSSSLEDQSHWQNQQNYEFLCDEDYQKLQLQNEKVLQHKWHLICEKLSLKFTMNEMWSMLDSTNELLYRQSCYQDLLVHDQSRYNSGSFLNFKKDPFKSKQQYPSKISFQNLMKAICSENERLETKVGDILETDKELCQLLVQEREKSAQLEHQVFALQEGRRHDDQEENHQECYIQELETQLQEARAALLEKKLKLTDKDDEVVSLKRQMDVLSQSFNHLEQEKREIEELVIKVSQDLKCKDYDTKDVNYRLESDKEHLMRQIEGLKSDLQYERGKQDNLETVEGNLVHKLQSLEQTNEDLKSYTAELEDKLEVKTDAIEKAQKVIQKLNEELEKSTIIMSHIEQEKDQLKKECKDQAKRIMDLDKQLQAHQTQQKNNNAQINGQLKNEIDELKEALRQYQQEYDQEKHYLAQSLRDLNEQKYQQQIQKEKSDAASKKVHLSLQETIDLKSVKIAELEQHTQNLEKEMKQKEEQFKEQLNLKDQQAQSNIQYLQRRLRDINVDDFRPSQGARGQSKDQQSMPQTSYLLTLKQEFEKAAKEVLDIRGLVKQESMDQVGISHKLRAFQEFKTVVMDQLEHWDQKSNDLASLASKYQSAFEDHRKMFSQLKLLVKEKDSLICQQQRQLQQRDQSHQTDVNAIKKELYLSHELMKDDLIGRVRAFEQLYRQATADNDELEQRFQSFKMKYAELLEDKEQVMNDNLRQQGQYEMVKRQLSEQEENHYQYKERLRVTLNIKHQGDIGQDRIVSELESLLDELRIKNDELISCKSQIDDYQEHAEQEKSFLQSRIKGVEEQLELIQRQSLSKEEEQQVLYLQKETKYINDIQRLQADCNSAQNEVQIRERQLKKSQNKLEQSRQNSESLDEQLEISSKEKQHLLEQLLCAKDDLRAMEKALEDRANELEENQKMVSSLKEKLSLQEDRCKQLKESLFDQQQECQRGKQHNIELQEENRKVLIEMETLDQKINVLERENENLFNETVMVKEQMADMDRSLEEQESNKHELQKAYELLSQVVEGAQEEVLQYQKTIEELSKRIEEGKIKDYQIVDLRGQVKELLDQERERAIAMGDMKRKLNPLKANAQAQTSDSGIQEISYFRSETTRSLKENRSLQLEAQQLREALSRLGQDFDRIIEEKRDLEDLVDQQNHSIKQIRLSSSLKENINVNNSSATKANSIYQGSPSLYKPLPNNDMFAQILQEKENYIMRLEQEVGEMRKECEGLRDKLIQHEMGSLSFENADQNNLNSRYGTSVNQPFGSLNQSNYYKAAAPDRLDTTVSNQRDRHRSNPGVTYNLY